VAVPTCTRDTPGRERTRCGLPAREQLYYMVFPTLRAEDGAVLVEGGPRELELCAQCAEELATALGPFLINAKRTALRQTLDFEDAFGQPWSAEMLRALAATMRKLNVPDKGRIPEVIEAQLRRVIDEDPELHAKIKREIAAIRLEKRARAESNRKAAGS